MPDLNNVKRWTKFFLQLTLILGGMVIVASLMQFYVDMIKSPDTPRWLATACLAALSGKVLGLGIFIVKYALKGW